MSTKVRSARRAAWLIAAALAVTSCGSKPPPPPTIVNVTLRATTDVNPSPNGTASPIDVRVYLLSSAAAFKGAEFFQIFDQDAATLKTDAGKPVENVLSPGETKTENLTPDAPYKMLGVFAAYREFQGANWRTTFDIPPNKTTNVTVTVGRAGLAVAATPAAGP